MSDIILNTGYVPRPLQAKIHQDLKRFNVLVCHRRFGKTILVLNELINSGLNNPLRYPQYAYIAPTYKQAKNISWQYLVEYTRVFERTISNIDLVVRIKRVWLKEPDHITITLVGSESSPDSLRGTYLDGCVMDEAAQISPIVWKEIVRPALADRGPIFNEGVIKGLYSKEQIQNYRPPFAIIMGTPKGKNHFYDIYVQAEKLKQLAQNYTVQWGKDLNKELLKWKNFEKQNNITEKTSEKKLSEILSEFNEDILTEYNNYRNFLASKEWYSKVYKASETGVLPQKELDALRLEMDTESYDQEMECSFTAVVRGSYFGASLNAILSLGQIGTFPYNPNYPVDTFWDIGVSDATAIWFRQVINGKFYYIDHFEANNQSSDFYAKVLDAKRNYFGRSVEVGDGVVITGEGYKYGKHYFPHDGGNRSWGSAKTPIDFMKKLGYYPKIIQKVPFNSRVDEARRHIKVSYFHAVKCEYGLSCLLNFGRKYDDTLKIFVDKPNHNWSSHSADAFSYSSLIKTGESLTDSIFNKENNERPKNFSYDPINCV